MIYTILYFIIGILIGILIRIYEHNSHKTFRGDVRIFCILAIMWPLFIVAYIAYYTIEKRDK